MAYLIGELPSPSNKAVLKAVSSIQKAKDTILKEQKTCEHVFLPTHYTDGYHTHGLFDIKLTCTVCGVTKILRRTPPLCGACLSPLEMKAYGGYPYNRGTESHIHLLSKEVEARRIQLKANPQHLPKQYAKIGLYICNCEACKEQGVPKFFIT